MITSYRYLCILTVIALIDRITKLWALAACAHTPIFFAPFLSCSITYNRGVAWSLMDSQNTSLFIIVTIIVIALTLGIAYSGYKQYTIGKNVLGECLIVAGSIGNIYDRFTSGGVIDFIELSYAGWYWPVFNVADIAVVIGVGIMFFVNYRERT